MPKFVVQEHAASHLHWDFRLELDGTGKSWAIPKKPPKTVGIKRLAIAVEDHPLSYFEFEGTIEKGYGAGTVKIWDAGRYKLIERSATRLLIYLKGRKMKGFYRLTRLGNPKHWLLYKVEPKATEKK